MSNTLVRYSYGPKAPTPAQVPQYKTKIVSTPVHGFYEMEPSVEVDGQAGTLAYLLGEPCDGYVHDVYQPEVAPGDGSLIGQALTYAGALALAKAWHSGVKAAAASKAEAADDDATADDESLALIRNLLDTPVDAVESVTVQTDTTPDAT